MKNKTAVEWLQEALEDTILTNEQIMQTIGLFEQAKEMEENQIVEAYLKGYLEEIPNPITSNYYKDMAQDYYNETFKKTEQ